jgi:hypothetical protein
VSKKLYDRTYFVGAARRTKTVSEPDLSVDQAAQSWRQSARAAMAKVLIDLRSWTLLVNRRRRAEVAAKGWSIPVTVEI